ncbi:MAG: single-stranded DNA-binding protein [Candidatus Azosocius agrarius]|nr:MAG: single-stranded DNA-binding protein [Gammaproteobacteria bacterium]
MGYILFGGINKVILIGNLGSDPKIISFVNKKTFVTLSLATTSSWKDVKTQEFINHVEWHRVVLYNKWALLAEKHLKKGSKIYIEGFLKTDKFEKNGNMFFSTKIICNNMLFLNYKDINKNDIENSSFNEQMTAEIPEQEIFEKEEDIPF